MKKNFIFAVVILLFLSCHKNESIEMPGLGWESVPEFSGEQVEGLAIGQDNTVYAAYQPQLSGKIVLLKSTDGRSWDRLKARIYDPDYQSSYTRFGNMSSLGVNKGTLYIGTAETEIFVKSAGDSLFHKVLSDHDDDIVDFMFYKNQVLAPGLRSGLYRSTDEGHS